MENENLFASHDLNGIERDYPKVNVKEDLKRLKKLRKRIASTRIPSWVYRRIDYPNRERPSSTAVFCLLPMSEVLLNNNLNHMLLYSNRVDIFRHQNSWGYLLSDFVSNPLLIVDAAIQILSLKEPVYISTVVGTNVSLLLKEGMDFRETKFETGVHVPIVFRGSAKELEPYLDANLNDYLRALQIVSVYKYIDYQLTGLPKKAEPAIMGNGLFDVLFGGLIPAPKSNSERTKPTPNCNCPVCVSKREAGMEDADFDELISYGMMPINPDAKFEDE